MLVAVAIAIFLALFDSKRMWTESFLGRGHRLPTRFAKPLMSLPWRETKAGEVAVVARIALRLSS